MSKKLTVAVVGATGAVGREMLKTLHDRKFPATEVRAFASARSAGSKVPFGEDELTVAELTEKSFEGIDLAIFSAGGATSTRFSPFAAHAGCVVDRELGDVEQILVRPEIVLVIHGGALRMDTKKPAAKCGGKRKEAGPRN